MRKLRNDFAVFVMFAFSLQLNAVEICIKSNGVRRCYNDQRQSDSQKAATDDAASYQSRVSKRYSSSEQTDFFSSDSMRSHGPTLAGAAVDVGNAISDAFASFEKANQERSMRYSRHYASGQTPEQKAQFYQNYESQTYKKLEIQNDIRNLELRNSETIRTSTKRREQFNHAISQAASWADTSHDIGTSTENHEHGSQRLELNVDGLSERQIAYLQAAGEMAVENTRDGLVSETIGRRWVTRVEKIHAFWTNENFRNACSKLKLSLRAQGTFFLPSVQPDSFETYEIISVSNQLARELSVVGDPVNRFLVTVMLNQAYRYAQEGETLASSMMLENALNVRDFSNGIATGLFENIRDTVSGLWHLVRHPVDSANAIGSAIINYEETFELIANKLSGLVNDFSSYSAGEKGQFFGYVAAEIAVTFSTGGTNWVADLAKTARFTEGVAIAVEKTAQVLKTPGLNKFETGFATLTDIGKRNVEFLRDYARREGYVLKENPLGRPEEWGLLVEGRWEWRVKIKLEGSTRDGLEAASRVPRASVRLDSRGNYINPFTGETGRKSVGGHIALEERW